MGRKLNGWCFKMLYLERSCGSIEKKKKIPLADILASNLCAVCAHFRRFLMMNLADSNSQVASSSTCGSPGNLTYVQRDYARQPWPGWNAKFQISTCMPIGLGTLIPRCARTAKKQKIYNISYSGEVGFIDFSSYGILPICCFNSLFRSLLLGCSRWKYL